MRNYLIHNETSGHSLGTWEGATEAEAIAALIADIGDDAADPALVAVEVPRADGQCRRCGGVGALRR